MIGIELTPEHPVDRIARLGEQAADAGFDVVFTSCHYDNRDPFQALDRIAARTDDVALGPGVANPYVTHPVALASRVATLDEASGGRAVFGIGAGDRSTLRPLGIERERPLRRVRETITAARRVWAGDHVTSGDSENGLGIRTFAARDARLNYAAAVRDDIPVFVGGQGPGMLRMAAVHADGVLVNGSHPRDLSWAADRIAEGLTDRPEESGPFTRLAYASVSIAETAAEARAAARPPVAFIAGGAPEAVLDRHGIDPGIAADIGAAIERGSLQTAFDLVTPGMIDAFAAAGTVDGVADRLAALLDHVDGIVVGAPIGPDLERGITLARDAIDRAGAG